MGCCNDDLLVHCPAMEYREDVRASDAMRVIVWAAVVALLAGAVLTAIAADSGRWIGVLSLLVTAGALALAGWWFLVLRVAVTPAEVSFRFGPFTKRMAPGDIERIAVTPYRWVSYGGWGLRMARGRRRAYTVPFLRTGVELTAADGRTYYVSSRNPPLLAAAIEANGRLRDGARQ